MDIHVVRTAGARDRLYVQRPDGSAASWVFPTCGPALIAAVTKACAGFGVPTPAALDPALATRVRDQVLAHRSTLRTLVPKGTLRLTWP